MRIWYFDFTSWLTWLSIAIGLTVTLAILWITGVLKRRREALAFDMGEIPWEQLLELLKAGQGPGSPLPEAWANLPSDQLLQLLLQQIPKRSPNDIPTAPGAIDDGDDNFSQFGRQRRNKRRRWINPTEVNLNTAFSEAPLKGLVINR